MPLHGAQESVCYMVAEMAMVVAAIAAVVVIFAMFAIRTLILNTIFEIFVSYFYAVQIHIE